jgi:hypothetical protein
MYKKKILPAHLPELLSLLSEMTGVMRERVLQKHFGLDSLHASLHASLTEGFHVLITFHRKVLEYNLGVFYGVPVMTLVT